MTIDDGPSSRLTPQILAILAERKIKATFFLLGRNVIGCDKLVQRIAAEGHEIGSHGYDHLFAWKVWPWQIVWDIRKGWQAIDHAMGEKQEVYPFRPPYGKLNLVSLLYLLWKKAPICYWTIDSGDTWPLDKRDASLAAWRIRQNGGGVTLLHDFDRAANNSEQYVLNVLNQIIEEGQRLGLSFGTLSQFWDKQ